jgi:GMP synthase-like glutamine amidotransferase
VAGASYLATFLKAKGAPFTEVNLNTEPLPPVAQRFRAIVVLGGIMGAYDESEFPWLRAEKAWLRAKVEQNVPVLGICLGCQLLADALPGGRAFASGSIEVRQAKCQR